MQLRKTFKAILAIFIYSICFLYTSILYAQNKKLESYIYMGEFTKEKAELVLEQFPPLDKLKPTHAVDLYKIKYKTTSFNGDTTIASGLVAMPINPKNSIAILCNFHGTRVTHDDAPSSFNANYYIYPSLFSNTGNYMLVMPDYLGMGDNELSLHPYVQAETLASSSIDMLIAAKELANVLHYPINNNLYLTGYSEGGFTTMVTYDAILKNHKDIHVTAVSAGSAPYDWLETTRFISHYPGPRATLYLAYFLYAMQTYHQYWEGLDVIFKKPYDTLIPTLFDGKHILNEILEALPAEPREIMRDDFYDSIINGTNSKTEQLVKNMNHYYFKSTAPLLLIGTKGDLDLPFHGAEIAYQELKNRSDLVYIKSVSDVLDHVQAAPLIMKEQLEFFQQY